MVDDCQYYLDFAKDTLIKCGKIAREWHLQKCPDKELYLNEFVSNLINSTILKQLNKELPDHHLFSKGIDNDLLTSPNQYEWICDPLDGAFLYSKGLTSCVISLTLVHNHEPLLTCIYQPFLGDMYWAIKSQGVFKNGSRLPANHQKLEEFTCINEEWWPDADYPIDRVIYSLARKYRLYPIHLGSVVYSACLVAEGALAATIFSKKLIGKNHEAATVMLLMQEAKGKYTDLNGKKIGFEGEMTGFIISTRESYDAIRQQIVKEFGHLD